MQSNHSTSAKVWGKARAANRDSGPQQKRVQLKVRIKSGTHPNLIARAQARGKVKADKDQELQQELEKLKINQGTQLNIMLKEQAMPENMRTRSAPKIAGTTSAIFKEIKPKRDPAKWPGPEAVLLTRPVR